MPAFSESCVHVALALLLFFVSFTRVLLCRIVQSQRRCMQGKDAIDSEGGSNQSKQGPDHQQKMLRGGQAEARLVLRGAWLYTLTVPEPSKHSVSHLGSRLHA